MKSVASDRRSERRVVVAAVNKTVLLEYPLLTP